MLVPVTVTSSTGPTAAAVTCASAGENSEKVSAKVDPPSFNWRDRLFMALLPVIVLCLGFQACCYWEEAWEGAFECQNA